MADTIAPWDDQVAYAQLLIQQLDRQALETWWDLGVIILQAKRERYWAQAGSLKDWLEGLNLSMSYSWYSRLADAVELTLGRGGKQAADQIGIAKLTRMIPAAKAGKLTDQLWEQAKVLSDRDLRIELGHRVPDEAEEWAMTCDGCGASFAVTCTHCKRVKTRTKYGGNA